MHYKTRYNIKHYNKSKTLNSNDKNWGFKVSKTEDIEKFADFWQKCARQRGMFLSQKEEIKAIYNAFGKNAVIHVASYRHIEWNEESQKQNMRSGVEKYFPQDDDENWLAAVLRISTKDVSYYMYAAASSEGKKLFAPTIVAWNAIKSAKNEGKKVFDFEGIFDERFPLKSWKGFTRFKRGFGGKEIEYPGCVSKIIF
jgi:lipid II:glycine glycyltransferase (peptidoglycan interpeptide bridge formation enzyme)